MKAFKKTTAILASAMIMTSSVIIASADEKLTREQIIDAFWGSAWGNLSDGTDYPQGSLEYHILETWLDDYYLASEPGEDETTTLNENFIPFNWADEHSVKKAFRNYFDDYTQGWHFADDNGTFYIESYDPITDTYGNDVLYHFELDGDTWLMLDEDEKIVDSFAVHGGDGSWSEWNVGEEDDGDLEEHEYESEDYNTGDVAAEGEVTETPRVTGTKAVTKEPDEEAAPQGNQRDEDEKTSQSKMPIIIGSAAVIALGALFMSTKKEKK